jgi:hypothetical protein
MEPSGSDKGFFQQAPVLTNQFYDDASFQRCFRCEALLVGSAVPKKKKESPINKVLPF